MVLWYLLQDKAGQSLRTGPDGMRYAVTVATMNLAGLKRLEAMPPQRFVLLARAVREMDCDALAVQETLAVVSADGRMVYNLLRDDLLPHLPGTWDWFFFPTVDSWQHPVAAKWATAVCAELFAADHATTALAVRLAQAGIPAREWQAAGRGGDAPRWWQSAAFRLQEGLAVAVRSPWAFRSLLGGAYGDALCPRGAAAAGEWYAGNRHGHAVTIPWYLDDDASFYHGDRDTNPRSLVVARLGCVTPGAEDGPDLVFGCTHLATLKEERCPGAGRLPSARARALRERQANCIAAYLGSLREAMSPRGRTAPVVLAGDLNCAPGAPELKGLLATGLVPVPYAPAADGPAYTHRRHQLAVDQILTSVPSPTGTAAIYDLGRIEAEAFGATTGREARWLSDHHPVWAGIGLTGSWG